MSVILETSDPAETGHEGVVLLRLNRPKALNALNLELRAALAESFIRLDQDAEVRAVVITGDERAFAAGADIKAMAQAGAMEMARRGLHRYWEAVGGCRKPVIAAVEGYALGGGCELALMADIIVAGEGAKFGQPEVRLGIMPGAGGTQRLLRAVGQARAMRLLLTGEQIEARTAEAWGLVSEVTEAGQAVPRALDYAGRIAKLPPLAVAMIKEVIREGGDLPLAAALMLERKSFQLLFDTADQKEGMAAFIEKRKPTFRGE